MATLPNLTRLRYFAVVADTLNFRQASEILHIAQPALSRSIQTLEDELGFKLLYRTTRHVSLTDAGAILAEDAKQAIQLLESSVQRSRQLAAGKAGEITLAYSAQVAQDTLSDLVLQFREFRPSVAVGLYQMASDEQLQAIKNSQVDVGLMLSDACTAHLSHSRVYEERFVLLVSRKHPLADRKSVALDELAALDFVMGSAGRWATFISIVNNVCHKAGFLPTVVDEASDVPVLLELVALERGVTLYGSAITSLLRPDVVAVPISDAHAAFDIGIVWDEKRLSPLGQELVAFIESKDTWGYGKS